MNKSKEFAEGVAFAMQQIRDFEIKHGHIHLDAIAANSLSVPICDFAIIFHAGQFEVVKRESPRSQAYQIIEK